ncbi:GGDEF domain-containing protein [Anatilimnocola floriformis]|uniref:GGDEF domain-containing protein n=1 Tax=Anatilimnocola floriformis TaxID=2948575 RepID=UPI0020C41142|nr:GGDEF domain-containing protein [Anatilimnocola floriformis]
MGLLMLGLPTTVALAAVVLLGYMFGQRTAATTTEQMQLRRELKRARGIIRDLEKVAQQVRRDLARHQGSLGKFASRLRNLSEAGECEPIDMLANETDKLLVPTELLTTRLTQAYEMIRQQADRLMCFSADMRTDVLTGFGNRQACEDTLALQIKMQQCGVTCSLATFDIDLFGHLNDEQGSVRGDQVLRQVAQILDQYTRESDVIFRYGGEEFVVLLPGTGLGGAAAFAERMRSIIERLSPVTISCGVAEAMAHDDAAMLFARADAALYSAKVAGRNQVYQHTGKSMIAVPCRQPAIATTVREQASQDQAVRETIRSVSQTLALQAVPAVPRPNIAHTSDKRESTLV